MRLLIIGANGAIGGCAVKSAQESGKFYEITKPSSSELRLGEGISKEALIRLGVYDYLILSFGTYGGLKSYSQDDLEIRSHNYWNDIKNIVSDCTDHNSGTILISSASVTNQQNFLKSSPYYQYVSEKKALEEIVVQHTKNSIILRPTNIISAYENYTRSGHVVASIFRNSFSALNGTKMDVWASPDDWREFTTDKILEDVFTNIFTNNFRRSAEPLTFGSGVRTYMSELVKVILKSTKRTKVTPLFTQKPKNGPNMSEIGTIALEQSGFDLSMPLCPKKRLAEVVSIWVERELTKQEGDIS